MVQLAVLTGLGCALVALFIVGGVLHSMRRTTRVHRIKPHISYSDADAVSSLARDEAPSAWRKPQVAARVLASLAASEGAGAAVAQGEMPPVEVFEAAAVDDSATVDEDATQPAPAPMERSGTLHVFDLIS